MINNKGVSIVEILLVIAIMVSLMTLSAPAYNYFQTSTRLNETSSQLIQAIRLAKERSTIGYNAAAHGVYLEVNAGDDSYVVYQGASFVLRDSDYDREFILNTNMDFTFVNFTLIDGDDVDINFNTGSGVPDNSGTIVLNYAGQVRQVVLNNLGLVELN